MSESSNFRTYEHVRGPELKRIPFKYPDDNIVVAFLANSGDGLYFDIQKIGELFYKK